MMRATSTNLDAFTAFLRICLMKMSKGNSNKGALESLTVTRNIEKINIKISSTWIDLPASFGLISIDSSHKEITTHIHTWTGKSVPGDEICIRRV